jgi:hypothetical protein
MYRIYVDEVGHHHLTSADLPTERYLGLFGVILDLNHAENDLQAALGALKLEIFDDENVILHRRDILNGRPAPFDRLKVAAVRDVFNLRLLELIESTPFTAIAVVIDKLQHRQQYAVWQAQPYHYCLRNLMERYVQWLSRLGGTGDVMIESRGKKENMSLGRSFSLLYDRGTENVGAAIFQANLTSREIKISPKSDNEAALQICDLLANPACRDLICRRTGVAMEAPFSRRIVEILYNSKYRRRSDGLITGWGTKFLP